MGQADYLSLGDWNALCDRCGFKFKASQLKRTWDGLMACTRCWEPRHPQDFVRGVQDIQTPPWTRPEPEPTYILFCTPLGLVGMAGYGIAGCMIPAHRISSGIAP